MKRYVLVEVDASAHSTPAESVKTAVVWLGYVGVRTAEVTDHVVDQRDGAVGVLAAIVVLS